MIEFFSRLNDNEGAELADTNGILEYLRENNYSAEGVKRVVDGLERSEAVGIEMEYGWEGPEGRTPVGMTPVLFIPENDVLPLLGEHYRLFNTSDCHSCIPKIGTLIDNYPAGWWRVSLYHND